MTPVRLALEPDDYVSALKLHARWSPRRLLAWAGVGAAAAVALVLLLPAWPAVVAGGVLGGTIGGLACYALSWFFYLPWKARRLFAQQKSLHESYDLEWGEAGLSVHGRLAQGTTPWDAYLRKRENERLVLLYQSDLLFQPLPKRAFSPEQWRSLAAYLDRIAR